MTARPGLHVAMWSALAPYTAVIGNPNLALLLGTGIAMWVYARQRTASRADLAEIVETSLMSAGVMILIIAASGGFGVALQATGIGSVIERAFVGQSGGAASGTEDRKSTRLNSSHSQISYAVFCLKKKKKKKYTKRHRMNENTEEVYMSVG